MKILVTGIISSGKTTFSQIIANKLKFPIYSTDDIAKRVRIRERVNKQLIKKLRFDPEIKLDRQLRTALCDDKKRTIINKIMHPKINKELQKILKHNRNCIIDSPIPKTMKILKFFDITILITASQRIIFERMQRLNFDKQTRDKLFLIHEQEFKGIRFDYEVINDGVNNLEKTAAAICHNINRNY